MRLEETYRGSMLTDLWKERRPLPTRGERGDKRLGERQGDGDGRGEQPQRRLAALVSSSRSSSNAAVSPSSPDAHSEMPK